MCYQSFDFNRQTWLLISCSDLLIRHERLSHNKFGPQKRGRGSRSHAAKVDTPASTFPETPQTSVTAFDNHHRASPAAPRPNIECQDDFPLATLSMAAEHVSLQLPYGTPSSHPAPNSPHVAFAQGGTMTTSEPPTQLDANIHTLELENSLDELSAFLDNGSLSSYHFSSLVSAEQPLPLFSPESVTHLPEIGHVEHSIFHYDHSHHHTDDPGSFAHFGSRLPSLQPEEQPPQIGRMHIPHRPLSEISLNDRKHILSKLNEFSSVIQPSFQLPSCLALARYVAAYINGFHEHLPFLHIATMSITHCSVELILAIAAVGTQYCLEGEKGIDLFYASHAIAMERIRRRDARRNAVHHPELPGPTPPVDGLGQNLNSCHSQPLSAQPGSGSIKEALSDTVAEEEDLIQTIQALLILMAMATWAKQKEILREALGLQSILATLVRDHGLQGEAMPDNVSWEEWVRVETAKRTKFIVYCFFNLHCIVYNIPSLILNSEVHLLLPSGSAEFKAPTGSLWLEAKQKASPEVNFQDALNRLFSRGANDVSEPNSSLGNYILIHAIIQHIFFLRQVARGRFDGKRDMAYEDVCALERALRNWQIGWKRHPESSLDPQDPNGPVAFNSTALLRLAYIRLNIDIGPGRALDTRDPMQIAKAFRASPPIQRTPKLVRAVLHSAHALSIPVKIGIRLVAQTQTFIWSIQHSICSLECAFLLSKWLEALSMPNPNPPISDDERRIAALVKMMLDETEFPVPADLAMGTQELNQHLNAGILRVWAQIFKGSQTWAIVGVIGNALNICADLAQQG
ncbi:predicted protein [Uncinocarpus reesii 1704]|uniref:Xylanolytic transcriptional activator regulatory domain-containing protein n=1 Tax=Uncinocarpus reesii (strain UAMH 1704) TaxID=336963 RepID=C4JQ51_UNCRE|nr:uncharacterized protein UREG_03284 [Uncinocarpus reesii 1704]EEP78438.1 predicted protein [Uncinocarpus reesii 1704]